MSFRLDSLLNTKDIIGSNVYVVSRATIPSPVRRINFSGKRLDFSYFSVTQRQYISENKSGMKEASRRVVIGGPSEKAVVSNGFSRSLVEYRIQCNCRASP